MTYIAFLRGINVGGHNVKMDKLRDLFAELGFENIRTYIQSGNVFFDSPQTNTVALEEKIEQHLLKSLGYEVPTYLRTIKDLTESLHTSPFHNTQPDEHTRHLVMFTKNVNADGLTLPLLSEKRDCEIVGIYKNDLFVRIHVVNGKWSDSGKLIKSLCGTDKGTGRFYHTLLKLLQTATN